MQIILHHTPACQQVYIVTANVDVDVVSYDMPVRFFCGTRAVGHVRSNMTFAAMLQTSVAKLCMHSIDDPCL